MDGHYIEARTVLWAAAEVSWQDAAGTSYPVPATLEDTSLSGACIRVQRPFTIGPASSSNGTASSSQRLRATAAVMDTAFCWV